ncbi:hypothetical protein F4824DRAFT_498906 [Ustulina deusta]|nr:hypothetical protein F4824DRAFT_498906 [Ustulina deusta]
MNNASANIPCWQPATTQVCIVATCGCSGKEHVPDGRNAGIWVPCPDLGKLWGSILNKATWVKH